MVMGNGSYARNDQHQTSSNVTTNRPLDVAWGSGKTQAYAALLQALLANRSMLSHDQSTQSKASADKTNGIHQRQPI